MFNGFYFKLKHKKSDTVFVSDFFRDINFKFYFTMARKSASVANFANSISF